MLTRALAVAVQRGLVRRIIVPDAQREVQKVVYDESQDGQAAPDHDVGGLAAHLRLVLAIRILASCPICLGELNRGHNV